MARRSRFGASAGSEHCEATAFQCHGKECAPDLSLKGILHKKDRRFKCAVRAEGPSQYQPDPVTGTARAEPMTGPGHRSKPRGAGRRSAQITEAIAPGDLRRPTACGPGRLRGPGPLRAFSPKADRAGIGADLRPAEFCPMMHVNLRCRSGISWSKLSSGARGSSWLCHGLMRSIYFMGSQTTTAICMASVKFFVPVVWTLRYLRINMLEQVESISQAGKNIYVCRISPDAGWELKKEGKKVQVISLGLTHWSNCSSLTLPLSTAA
jgi:hypothetical protein